MNAHIAYHYRRSRAHQAATYGNSGLWENGRDLRQFTGGGACYGEHVLAAYHAARSTVAFMARHAKPKGARK